MRIQFPVALELFTVASRDGQGSCLARLVPAGSSLITSRRRWRTRWLRACEFCRRHSAHTSPHPHVSEPKDGLGEHVYSRSTAWSSSATQYQKPIKLISFPAAATARLLATTAYSCDFANDCPAKGSTIGAGMSDLCSNGGGWIVYWRKPVNWVRTHWVKCVGMFWLGRLFGPKYSLMPIRRSDERLKVKLFLLSLSCEVCEST